MKRCRRGCKLILLMLVILFLTGCGEFRYQGEHPELYTAALSSIPGQRGSVIGGVGGLSPRIIVLAEDSYGRILFSYDEALWFYHMIVQKTEGNYVYFYQHYNFIAGRAASEITDEMTEILKEVNNWNQPLSDDSEFARVQISRQRLRGPVSDDQIVEMHEIIFPGLEVDRSGILANVHFLRTDNYGRSVYSTTGGVRVVLFQPDHSFKPETGALEISDLNYQTELRLLMEANGWNEPWEE